ncbi:hypothetical protein Taro_014092 [Colocasia esculenta]|uniref:Uncharacterized protein n=1 Tax=Colocasia esculenta TaxID=4460 RepID=A0A843UI10_COLES|nr:hypothetical protein [Colocasia esculenta]
MESWERLLGNRGESSEGWDVTAAFPFAAWDGAANCVCDPFLLSCEEAIADWDWDFDWNMSEVIPHIGKSTGLRLAPNPRPTATTTTANLKTPSLLSFPVSARTPFKCSTMSPFTSTGTDLQPCTSWYPASRPPVRCFFRRETPPPCPVWP